MNKLVNYILIAIRSIKKRGIVQTFIFIVGEYWFDVRFHVNTRPYFLNADNSIVGLHLSNAAPHYGTNWFILKNVFQKLIHKNIVNPPFTHMIDFGCGAGRAMMAAQLFCIAKVTGVEFCRTLCQRAEENLLKFTSGNSKELGSNWKVVHADACSYSIPHDATLFFLYNPFGRPVIDIVAQSILDHSLSERCSITVIYVNPIHATVFDQLGYLKLQDSSEEVAIYGYN